MRNNHIIIMAGGGGVGSDALSFQQRNRNGRLEWVDILKGIGIISVVVGHILDVRYVFVFHMPLFFLISGYLFHARANNVEYIKQLSVRLMLPYFSFLIIFNLFTLVVYGNRLSLNRFLYGGYIIGGIYAVFWYITVLYLSLFFLNCLVKNQFNIIVTFITLLLIAYAFSICSLYFAWNTQVVPMAISYMYVGYQFKKYPPRKNPYFLFVMIVLIIISFVSPLFFPQLELDMKYTDYGIPVISFVVSCLICYGLFLIACRIEMKWAKSALMLFGRASLLIMYLHMFINIVAIKSFQIESVVFRFIMALFLPLACYVLVARSRMLRLIFLGLK